MVASSSAVPSPALCPRPQNAVTPDHYPMAPLGPSGGPLSNHAGAASSGMPFRGQFINHAVQMGLPPHMSDG
uniref:CNOT2 n=1 Tax=Elaeophora elaphi TaxID=1147741 RepID=A0A0R3S6D0_9BILA